MNISNLKVGDQALIIPQYGMYRPCAVTKLTKTQITVEYVAKNLAGEKKTLTKRFLINDGYETGDTLSGGSKYHRDRLELFSQEKIDNKKLEILTNEKQHEVKKALDETKLHWLSLDQCERLLALLNEFKSK